MALMSFLFGVPSRTAWPLPGKQKTHDCRAIVGYLKRFLEIV
jgi:hypothetical protein